MAKTLHDWLASDVEEVRHKSMRWLSEGFFFRDPNRPIYSDPSYFFPPADGIILYVKQVCPDRPIVEIKGRSYSLCEGLRDATYDKELRLLIGRSIRLSYLLVAPLLLISLVFPELVLSIFTPDPELMQAALPGLIVVLLATLVAVPGENIYSAVAGTGDTRVLLGIQVLVSITTLISAAIAALWLGLALEYILLAEVFGWVTCLLLSWFWFNSGLWRRLDV